jgi:hypothetical protein
MVSMSSFGRDPPVDVHDVVVLEDPDHLADRVAVADVGQELVAQALALARALDDAGDVDEVDGGRDGLGRPEQLRQLRQPGCPAPHDADVRLDRRERVVGRQHVVLGERVEQRALADVGQADDAEGETHAVRRYRRGVSRRLSEAGATVPA